MHKGKIFWNGECSLDLGIVVEEVPSLDRPQRKFKTYEVPGRSGTIIEQQDAYNNINKEYEVWFTDWFFKNINAPAKAAEVASWLYSGTGYLRLEDDFEPTVYRMAYFNGPLNVENLLQRYGKCKITFNCRPERFLKSGEEILENPTTIHNPTQFASRPLIKVEGSGDCFFTIQGQTVNIAGLVDYIYLDCETMDAYRQSAENKNSMVSGTIPTLKPGDNAITKSSGVTKLSITPRFWTL